MNSDWIERTIEQNRKDTEDEQQRVETHPIIDALSIVATFRSHENRALLDLAESYLTDVELSDEDRRVLVEVYEQIGDLLGLRKHADVILERIERDCAPTTRKKAQMSHVEILHTEGYDYAMSSIRRTLESRTEAITVVPTRDTLGIYNDTDAEVPENMHLSEHQTREKTQNVDDREQRDSRSR